MEPVIRINQLSKRFGRQVALDRVSLEIPPGCVFALLGENGAGKTTAIRILLGLAEPDAGQTEVLGLDSQRQGLEIRRRVGYVPERPTLYDWMTVAEVGWFAAGFYPDGYFPHYLELIHNYALPEGRKLKALSKGQRAKVALALALAHDPELLVLDEPTSGLDALVRREFLESMVDRAAGGKSVLLSSHQIAEVERVADYVAILREGHLLVVERVDELKNQIDELTLTLADQVMPKLELSGEVLALREHARQWQLLVRGLSDADRASIEGHPAITVVEHRRPNLEEIFIAYMQREPSRNGHASLEVPVR